MLTASLTHSHAPPLTHILFLIAAVFFLALVFVVNPKDVLMGLGDDATAIVAFIQELPQVRDQWEGEGKVVP